MEIIRKPYRGTGMKVSVLKVWVYEGEGCFQTPHAYRARYA